MTRRFRTTLHFAPTGQDAGAVLRPLSRRTLAYRVVRDWWATDELAVDPLHPPIDRHWAWPDTVIERAGVVLRSTKVGIVTDDEAVQGAMVLSVDPVESSFASDGQALFVELLCTAPWNRPHLRRDGRKQFVGAGTELVEYAAHASRAAGFHGRLRLEASPESIPFYTRLGFEPEDADLVRFEGTVYTPMELSARAAGQLLLNWQGRAIHG